MKKHGPHQFHSQYMYVNFVIFSQLGLCVLMSLCVAYNIILMGLMCFVVGYSRRGHTMVVSVWQWSQGSQTWACFSCLWIDIFWSMSLDIILSPTGTSLTKTTYASTWRRRVARVVEPSWVLAGHHDRNMFVGRGGTRVHCKHQGAWVGW